MWHMSTGARRVCADAMRENHDETTHDEPEDMSGADLCASRLAREYRAEMAKHREEMLRQQWGIAAGAESPDTRGRR